MHMHYNFHPKGVQRIAGRSRRNLPGLLLLFFILWACVAWGRNNLLQYNIKTFVAQEGLVEGKCTGTGLLFTDELLLPATAEGILQPLVAEGERVPAGTVVAKVLTMPNVGQVIATLGEMEEEARELLEELNAGASAGEELLIEKANQLAAKIQELRDNLHTGQTPHTQEIVKDIKELLGERQRLLAELAQRQRSSPGKGKELPLEEERLAKLLPSTPVPIVAPRAGVVSFHLPGAGERFAYSKISETGVFEFAALEELEVHGQTMGAGVRVKAGEPVLRLVNNLAINVAVPLPATEAQLLENKKTGTIIFPELGEWKLDCPVVFTIIEGDRGVVVLELSAYRPELLAQRKLAVQLVGECYEGFVVPRGALLKRGPEMGVYIKGKQGIIFQPVQVLGGDGDMVVVEGISFCEEVIANPAWVREGQRVR
ncbi:MAG: hypothetical protein GX349_07355 [Firmicutes bacterium]|nr:hypothetical protein [Bacillota bacterium]